MTTSFLPAALATRGSAGTATVPARTSHAWRTLLESRWGERLITVITVSLAYHDAAEHSTALQARGGAARQQYVRRARRLMTKAVAARRDLSETEEALARLSDGRFGRCEQCRSAIPENQLARVPETRYCPCCTSRD
jgi:RNA polymerase-binding transcription factor DksA